MISEYKSITNQIFQMVESSSIIIQWIHLGGGLLQEIGPMRLIEMDRSSQFNFRRLDNQLGTFQSNHIKLENLLT